MAQATTSSTEPIDRDDRPVRIAMPGGVAWVNLPAIRKTHLPVEAAALAQALEPLFTGDLAVTETFKNDHRSCVQRIELAGDTYVWKQFLARPRRKQICRVRHWLRLSSPWSHWFGAGRLARAGVRTAQPLALIDSDRLGPGGYALLLPSIEGVTVHRYLKQAAKAAGSSVPTAFGPMALAKSVGRQIGQMTACGLINRDHKPGNLLVDQACLQDDVGPVVIDQSAIRLRRGDRQVYRMLATLLRTAGRAAPVSTRQGLICLKAMRSADPSFAADIALGRLARRVLTIAQGQQGGQLPRRDEKLTPDPNGASKRGPDV